MRQVQLGFFLGVLLQDVSLTCSLVHKQGNLQKTTILPMKTTHAETHFGNAQKRENILCVFYTKGCITALFLSERFFCLSVLGNVLICLLVC